MNTINGRRTDDKIQLLQHKLQNELDDYIVWNAHNTVFGSKSSAMCTSCLLSAFDEA